MVFKLAQQLTGPSQQAYSALSVSDAVDYDKVKEAIWARYDINCEMYRRRLREAAKKPEAEHLAEELVKTFSSIGIPSEILTDQGANFMSKLLAEVYRLLSVKVIRTSPPHP